MPDTELAYSDAREKFPGSFGRIYKEKYLTEEMKQEITKLCQDAIDAYDNMFDSVDWLSEETRKEAKNKLHKMKINAVYPDKWDDDSIYVVKSKEEGGTLLQAILDYGEALRKDSLSRLNTTIDRDIWMVDMLDTNAFYSISESRCTLHYTLADDSWFTAAWNTLAFTKFWKSWFAKYVWTNSVFSSSIAATMLTIVSLKVI